MSKFVLSMDLSSQTKKKIIVDPIFLSRIHFFSCLSSIQSVIVYRRSKCLSCWSWMFTLVPWESWFFATPYPMIAAAELKLTHNTDFTGSYKISRKNGGWNSWNDFYYTKWIVWLIVGSIYRFNSTLIGEKCDFCSRISYWITFLSDIRINLRWNFGV